VGPGKVEVVLRVNGVEKRVALEPRATLAEALRLDLGMMGTKIGCDRGACGACTVWLDGAPVVACTTFAFDAVGRAITTIEGLANGDARCSARRDRRRDAVGEERLQGPHVRGARPPNRAACRRCNLKTDETAEGSEDTPRRLPLLCDKLRTKRSFGSYAATGASDWREGKSSTAVYWCLKTMETWGTDDDFAHPHKCRAGRACFVAPDVA
jgi:hypothetical protein